MILYNEEKIHTITSCNDIAEIMLPQLLKHGITIFNYYKTYFDGSAVRLSTHREWSKHYLEKGYNLNTTVPSAYLIKPLNYFIWLIKDCPAMLTDQTINFDFSNGISIVHRNENSIEYYAFGAKTNNTSIINFYLNNLDLLHNYCLYFKERAKTLLEIGERNKIQINTIETNEENPPLSQILNLSNRQFECATLLLNGMNSKKISSELNLSSRTIEHYIDTLKKKLHCKNIIELVVKLAKVIKTDP